MSPPPPSSSLRSRPGKASPKAAVLQPPTTSALKQMPAPNFKSNVHMEAGGGDAQVAPQQPPTSGIRQQIEAATAKASQLLSKASSGWKSRSLGGGQRTRSSRATAGAVETTAPVHFRQPPSKSNGRPANASKSAPASPSKLPIRRTRTPVQPPVSDHLMPQVVPIAARSTAAPQPISWSPEMTLQPAHPPSSAPSSPLAGVDILSLERERAPLTTGSASAARGVDDAQFLALESAMFEAELQKHEKKTEHGERHAKEATVDAATAMSPAMTPEDKENASRSVVQTLANLVATADDKPLRLSQLDAKSEGKIHDIPIDARPELANIAILHDGFDQQLRALEELQNRMYSLNHHFWEKNQTLMAEQTQLVQAQAVKQMQQLQHLQYQQTEWQTNQIRRLQTSFAQVAHGETSRVPSSMTSRAPADNDKKSTAIAGIQSRLEKIQGEFQKFLSSVDAIKANVEKAEARKKEVVAVARPLSPGKSATTSLHSTPSLESKLGTSPLDAILNDIHCARQSHEPHPSPVDTGVGAGTFDYKSASRMMDEIKAVRVQIAAGIVTSTTLVNTHNTTMLDVDMTSGAEKTHLSEESTLADLREVFPTTRLQQAVDGQIHDTDIEPVIIVPHEQPPLLISPTRQPLAVRTTRAVMVKQQEPASRKVTVEEKAVAKTSNPASTAARPRAPPAARQAPVLKKPPPMPPKTSRAPARVSPQKQTTRDESRPSSPVRSTMPRFYTVRLSEKPIFLRRTTIRPPSMDFTSTPLDPEPLPKSPVKKSVSRISSPKRKTVAPVVIDAIPKVVAQTPPKREIVYLPAPEMPKPPVVKLFDMSVQTSPPPAAAPPVAEKTRPMHFDIGTETDRVKSPPPPTPVPSAVVHKEEQVQTDVQRCEDSTQTDIVVEIPPVEVSQDDLGDRMKSWLQEELSIRFPAKLPNRDQSSSVGDLPSLVVAAPPKRKPINPNPVAMLVMMQLVEEVVDDEVRRTLLDLLARRRDALRQAPLICTEIVREVVDEECRKMAHAMLKQRHRARLDAIARDVQRELLDEFIREECEDVAQWALRTRTPEPIVVEKLVRVPTPPIVVHKEEVALQTDVVESSVSSVSEDPVPTPSITITNSLTTMTTLSSIASAGELLTDIFSDGEVVEPFGAAKIQCVIEENAPRFRVDDVRKTVELLRNNNRTSSVLLNQLDEEELSASVHSSIDEERTLSKGEVDEKPRRQTIPAENDSASYSAGELNKKPFNDEHPSGSLGELSDEQPPWLDSAMRRRTQLETPAKSAARAEIQVQPPSFINSSTMSGEEMPSPITSPINKSVGDAPKMFDTTVHVEHQSTGMPALPQDARDILRQLEDLSQGEMPQHARYALSPGGMSTVSGATSIPDIASDDGSLEEIGREELDAMEF